MIRIGTRRATAVGTAVAALATVTVLSGCGAGQVSQVATQVPAIDGNSATVGTNPRIALRNVYLHMVTPESGSIPAGTPVPLIFTAVNESPVRKATDPADYYPQPLNDELVSVTSDFGAVALTSAASPMIIKPGQSLVSPVTGDVKGTEELAKVPGTSVTQVSQLVKQFSEMQKMMKRMGAMGMGRPGKKGKKASKGKRSGGLLGMPNVPGGLPNLPGMPGLPGAPGAGGFAPFGAVTGYFANTPSVERPDRRSGVVAGQAHRRPGAGGGDRGRALEQHRAAAGGGGIVEAPFEPSEAPPVPRVVAAGGGVDLVGGAGARHLRRADPGAAGVVVALGHLLLHRWQHR